MTSSGESRIKGDSEVRQLRRQVTRLDKKTQHQAKKIATLEEENRLLTLQLKEYQDKIFKKNKCKEPADD